MQMTEVAPAAMMERVLSAPGGYVRVGAAAGAMLAPFFSLATLGLMGRTQVATYGEMAGATAWLLPLAGVAVLAAPFVPEHRLKVEMGAAVAAIVVLIALVLNSVQTVAEVENARSASRGMMGMMMGGGYRAPDLIGSLSVVPGLGAFLTAAAVGSIATLGARALAQFRA